MSLLNCPLADVCPKYENGTKGKDHYHRMKHPCKQFLATCCEMGMQLEMFLADKPIACLIDKGKKK